MENTAMEIRWQDVVIYLVDIFRKGAFLFAIYFVGCSRILLSNEDIT